MDKKNILITGKPGCGKTTLIVKLIERLKDRSLGGFYTQELRAGKERAGFKIKTLDGKEGVLAAKYIRSPYKVGSYCVNMPDLEEIGVIAIYDALKDKDIIIIDEIGKMELFSNKFKEMVNQALDSPKKILAAIQDVPEKFVDRIKAREDTELITITQENRDALVEELAGKI